MTSGKCDLQFGFARKAPLEHSKLIFAVSLQQLWFWVTCAKHCYLVLYLISMHGLSTKEQEEPGFPWTILALLSTGDLELTQDMGLLGGIGPSLLVQM